MLLTAVTTATAQKEPIRIDLSKRGAVVSPNLYGIFFEEISHAGDGGLYAELVQNRGFEEHVLPSGMTYREDIRKSRLSTPLAIQTACWSRFPATIWLTHTGIAALISSLPTTTSSMKPPRTHGIYVGEYACNGGVGAGNLLAALSEAAFIMGMERNSDVVKMSSYAPLFENENRRNCN